MHENRRLSLFGTGAKQVEATQERDARDIRVLRESLDLVIMNPPFTRPTNHEKTEVPRPSFAGLATSEAEQEMMSRRLGRMRGKFGHGNAGLASNFMDLAHNKLKPGGILALVLPFAFVAGRSWGKARTALVARSDGPATLADVEHPLEFDHQIVRRRQPRRVGSASTEQPHQVRAPHREPTCEVVLPYRPHARSALMAGDPHGCEAVRPRAPTPRQIALREDGTAMRRTHPTWHSSVVASRGPPVATYDGKKRVRVNIESLGNRP